MQPLFDPRDRERRLTACEREIFDLLVVGGGIHGAAVARDAALRGLTVLLLEQSDFASGTSSRSSKLLHGGVRYLEQGDFRLLYEALGERAIMCGLAPHLARFIDFAFPVTAAADHSSFTIGLGLRFYDLLARLHRFTGRGALAGCEVSGPKEGGYRRYAANDPLAVALKGLGLTFSGLHGYIDGQMEDTRLVIEHIVDTELLGGTVLNYTEILSASRDGAGSAAGWQVRAKDRVTNQELSVRARAVVSCAGPWTKVVSERFGIWDARWPNLMLSRGSHLLFRRRWPHPGLILPAEAPGRVYFVLPFFSAGGEATLVGTTDVEIVELEEEPEVSGGESELLLRLLARDLPAAGLDERSLYHSFAGVRALPRVPGRRSSNVSRSEHYLEAERYITFLGGKYTTARLTAQRLVDRAERQLRGGVTARSQRSTAERLLPGGQRHEGAAAAELQSRAAPLSDGLESTLGRALGEEPASAANAAGWLYSLFGGRAAQVARYVDSRDLPSERLLLAAARFVRATEHAVFAEDIFSRRLLRERCPDRKGNELELVRTTLVGPAASGGSVE